MQNYTNLSQPFVLEDFFLNFLSILFGAEFKNGINQGFKTQITQLQWNYDTDWLFTAWLNNHHYSKSMIFTIPMSPIDTTRARKCHEREGIEYHFITRTAFETDIQNSKWVLNSHLDKWSKFIRRINALVDISHVVRPLFSS